MSFIYDDPNLLDTLIETGLDFKLKFTKQGQAAGAAVDKDFSNLNTLISNLEKAVTPVKEVSPEAKDPNAPAQVSFEKDPANPGQKPKLTSTNEESLGALVAFLAANRMTVDGQRIAYTEDPGKPEYVLYRLEPNAGLLERADRAKTKQGFYVNKDLLVKFIQSRLAALSTKPNPVEKAQLGDLIQESNKLLDTNIDPKYKPEEQLLPFNTVLDNLPVVLSEENPNAAGPIPLTFADLQSRETLNGWLSKNDMSIRIGKDWFSFKDRDNFDQCVVAKVLYTRAKGMDRNRTPENAKVTAAYVKQMEKVGPTMVGKDGEACDIGVPSAPSTPGAAGGQAGPQVLQNLVNGLPLDVDSINFQRINSWINEYKKIVNSSKNKDRKASDMAAMNNVANSMRSATALTKDNKQDFELSSADASTVEGWLTPPAAEKYLSLLYHLRTVLESTYTLLGNFYAAYVRKASPEDRDVFTSEQRTAVEGQILGGGSVYKDNWDNIRALESKPPKVVPAR